MKGSLALERALLIRRAVRDRGLLIVFTSMVALAALVSVGGPRVVLSTIDGGVQDIVRSSGPSGDVLITTMIGDDSTNTTSPTRLSSTDEVLAIEQALPERLTGALKENTDSISLSVIGSGMVVHWIDNEAQPEVPVLSMRLAMTTNSNVADLELVEGRLPTDSYRMAEVALSEDVAASLGATIGTVFGFSSVAAPGSATSAVDAPFSAKVVGIVAPRNEEPTEATWVYTPNFWEPVAQPAKEGAAATTRFTALTSAQGVTLAAAQNHVPVEAKFRLALDLDHLTVAKASAVAAQVEHLNSNPRPIAGSSEAVLSVVSRIGDLIEGYPVQTRAVLAQMSVMVAGVTGVAAVVVILLSRLIVLYRASSIALERARGASTRSIGVRAAIESAVVTIVGCLVGTVLALILVPGSGFDPLPLIVVALVSFAATPLQSMVLASRVWTGRREPANRRDRARRAARLHARRAVIELSVLALAAAALYALRTRGLLQTRTDGIDPLLSLAPILVAIAMTIIIIRFYPFPVRAAIAVARRARGVLGLLGAARAEKAVAALPLLAITLGAAVAVGGGLLVSTVRDGQVDASWQRVGADVRVEPSDPNQIDAAEVRTLPGVDIASAAFTRPGVGIDAGASSVSAAVVAIDGSFAAILDAVPGQHGIDALRALDVSTPIDEPLPVVVDTATARALGTGDITMSYGPRLIDLRVIGTTEVTPLGYVRGMTVYVDLDSLNARLPEPITKSTVYVDGDGAEAAIASLDLPDGTVVTRVGWIEERRDLAIVAGVERAMIFASLAAALLAAVGLMATAIGGARERGRALAMLRTLGMRSRLGWWLALAELAPVVIAALIGGAIAGIVVVVTLSPALGLEVLADGRYIPTPSISPVVILSLVVCGVVVLGLGVLAEVLVHRRDKLNDVLRVGES